ncbi:MAG: ACP S-malonyltransferase [Chloroflexi bacterium]|nr:ACP S-malonyltransferase [Chloroflexota bacterium]
MPASYALLFPGQASQKVGMGRALAADSPSAAAVFALAEEVTGLPITRLCFEGPDRDLVRTEFLQPCLAATSLATLAAALEESGAQDPSAPVSVASVPNPPRALAGHSVGEIPALAAAGALELRDAFKVVAERARAMAEAGEANPGGMLALIGGDLKGAYALCELVDAGGPGFRLGVANLNAPGQTIVAGAPEALKEAADIAREWGFRRALELPVSAAFHTPYMEPARSRLAELIKDLPVRDPRIPVVSNVSGDLISDAASVREEICAQVVAPVLWSRSVQLLSSEGITSFFEVGPGNVLSGLLRRIIPSARGIQVGEPEQLRSLADSLNGTIHG